MRIELSGTWPAVEDYFERGNDLVVMATGSHEEHGRYNPLGTDTLAPNLLLERLMPPLARRAHCAFTIPFATRMTSVPGTLDEVMTFSRSLVWTLSMQLCDYGARRFLFINGYWPKHLPPSQACAGAQ